MKQLELKKRTEVITLQEVINETVVTYDFEKEYGNVSKKISFYASLPNGLTISGNYSFISGLYLNTGLGITAEEIVLMSKIIETILAIAEDKYTTEEEATEDIQTVSSEE